MEYEATIEDISISDNGDRFATVELLGYGDRLTVWLVDLIESHGQVARDQQEAAFRAATTQCAESEEVQLKDNDVKAANEKAEAAAAVAEAKALKEKEDAAAADKALKEKEEAAAAAKALKEKEEAAASAIALKDKVEAAAAAEAKAVKDTEARVAEAKAIEEARVSRDKEARAAEAKAARELDVFSEQVPAAESSPTPSSIESDLPEFEGRPRVVPVRFFT